MHDLKHSYRCPDRAHPRHCDPDWYLSQSVNPGHSPALPLAPTVDPLPRRPLILWVLWFIVAGFAVKLITWMMP